MVNVLKGKDCQPEELRLKARTISCRPTMAKVNTAKNHSPTARKPCNSRLSASSNRLMICSKPSLIMAKEIMKSPIKILLRGPNSLRGVAKNAAPCLLGN